METLIALVRNGSCVVKDLLEGSPHWLNAPLLGRMTALDAVIAPLQFAAVLYNWTTAVPHLTSVAAACLASTSAPSEAQWSQAVGLTGTHKTCQLLQCELASHFASSRQRVRVMACKLVIGGAFLALFLNSIKSAYATSATINWNIVGLELAVAYLLTVMAAGVGQSWRLAADARRLARALAGGADPLSAPAAIPLLLDATHRAVGGTDSKLPPAPWEVGRDAQCHALQPCAPTLRAALCARRGRAQTCSRRPIRWA